MEADPQNCDVERLLTHADWLRALARSLVADGALADDLAQETWLAAMRRPPRADDPRGWLARTLRNAWRKEVRDRRRREAREQGTEARDGADSAELVQRVEAQRMLAGLVLGLGEPYRSTLIGRYYGGLSAVEIARRDGVPAGTVRWRLHAALEELRTRLAARHGAREVWSAALAPLAPFAWGNAAGRSGAAATAGIAGGLVMGIKAVLACAAVAAVAGGLYLGFRGADQLPAGELAAAGAPERMESPPGGSRAREAAGAGLALAADAGGRVALETAAAEAGPRAVRVVVLRAFDRKPVAGVSVRLSPYGEAEPVLATALTDGEGRASLVPAQGVARGRLAALSSDGAGCEHDLDDLAGELELYLVWHTTLTGVVRDAETGEPLEGAEVFNMPCSARTGADGRYALEDLLAGFPMPIGARKDGYVESRSVFHVQEPGAAELDFALERGFLLELRFFDRESGLPVAGVELASSLGAEPFVRADGEGAAPLRASVGARMSLYATAPGYWPWSWSWEVQARPETPLLRVPLVREAWLEARVVDGLGQPVEGAFLSAECRQHEGLWIPAGEGGNEGEDEAGPGKGGYLLYPRAEEQGSDLQGRSRLSLFPCGHAPLVHSYHPSFVDAVVALGSPLAPGEVRRVDVALAKGGAIRGRVLENGAAIAGAEIQWRRSDGAIGGRESTDGDGRYLLANVTPGTVSVLVAASRVGGILEEAQVAVEVGETAEHDFVRTFVPAEIRGRVTSGGSPVAGVSVRAFANSGASPLRPCEAETDEQGAYRLAVQDGAVYAVQAGQRPALRERSGVSAGATDVDFELPAQGTLRLRLVDAGTGAPVHMAQLRFDAVCWRSAGGAAFDGDTALGPDMHGRQDLVVEAGLVDVLVHLAEEGYAPRLVEGVRVPAGGESELLTVELEPGIEAHLSFAGDGVAPEDLRDHLLFIVEQADLGRIEGPFAEQGGRSNYRIDGVCMRLESTTLMNLRLRVGRDGAALVPGLRPGRYHLRVYPDDFAFEPAAFDLPAPTEEPLRIAWRRR